MAKRNEDETENVVSDKELNVHCSNKDVSVPAPLLHPLMKVKRFWLMMMKILQSFQKIVFQTSLRLLLYLYTLKKLTISKLNQRLSMRHYFIIFILCQQRTVGCAKYAIAFLRVILEVEPL